MPFEKWACPAAELGLRLAGVELREQPYDYEKALAQAPPDHRSAPKFATAGEANPEELDLYARVAANLRRLMEAVGLKRRALDVSPTLGDLLRHDHDVIEAEAVPEVP